MSQLNATPKTDYEALISGALGGASVAAPAAALLVLAKAYRQERRRTDLARAKNSDTLVITLPEKRGQLIPWLDVVGGKLRETATAIGDKVKGVGTGSTSTTATGPGWLSTKWNVAADALKGAKDAVSGVRKTLTIDNVGNALQGAIRAGFRAAKGDNDASEGVIGALVRNAGGVARTFAGETADAAKLPAASRQALKYLAAVIAGGTVLRGADALYDVYNQRKLRRLEEASRKEYINRLFAKGAQAAPQAPQQDGQLVGGVMAIMALIAGTSAYGTKKVLDVMYPKTYTKVKAPTVRRIEFRSLPRDAQKADAAEEYEEFQDTKPTLKAAAVLEDGSEYDLPWDVVHALGLRHALLQDATDNGFRKFANHEAVLDWCAERHVTTDQLREKLAQTAQLANPQQQAEFYRMVDDVMKDPALTGRIDEIAQTAAQSGRAATSLFDPERLAAEGGDLLNRMRPDYVRGPHIAAARTRDAIVAKIRQEMASGLANNFGLAMPGFASAMVTGGMGANIAAEVEKRRPELQSLAYKALAANQNVAAVLAKNVQETAAYKNMSPTLKKVMDWLGKREAGSIPRMLYDWIIKRQVAAGLNNAEANAANTRASIFANATPAKPEAAPETAATATQPRPSGARRKGQPSAAKPVQPPAATYGMPGGLGGMPAFAGRSESNAISPMVLGAMVAATPVEPGAPAQQPGNASPGLTLNPRQNHARLMAVGATPPAAAPAPTAAPAAAPPAAAEPAAAKPAAQAPRTSAASGPRGASNVINGEPFFDFLPKRTGYEHAASAGFSPSSLAEKLLTAPKKDREEEDEDAVRKLPPAKRRHIEVEAADPRAEEFVRKNKTRLVAALSNAVNSGDL